MPKPTRMAALVDSLGGTRAVATALRLNVSSVYRYTIPKSRGGTRLPIGNIGALLALARAKGIPLTAEELVG